MKIVSLLAKHSCGKGFCALNCVITNGKNTVISRFSYNIKKGSETLYISKDMDYSCEDGVSVLRKPIDSYHKSIIVSSEPLNKDPCWKEFNEQSVLMIDEHLGITEKDISYVDNIKSGFTG